MNQSCQWEEQLAMAVIADAAHRHQEGQAFNLMEELKPFLPAKGSTNKVGFQQMKSLVAKRIAEIESDMATQSK